MQEKEELFFDILPKTKPQNTKNNVLKKEKKNRQKTLLYHNDTMPTFLSIK